MLSDIPGFKRYAELDNVVAKWISERLEVVPTNLRS